MTEPGPQPGLDQVLSAAVRAAMHVRRAESLIKDIHTSVERGGHVLPHHVEQLDVLDSAMITATHAVRDELGTALRALARNEPVQVTLPRGDLEALGELLQQLHLQRDDAGHSINVGGAWRSSRDVAGAAATAIKDALGAGIFEALEQRKRSIPSEDDHG